MLLTSNTASVIIDDTMNYLLVDCPTGITCYTAREETLCSADSFTEWGGLFITTLMVDKENTSWQPKKLILYKGVQHS